MCYGWDATSENRLKIGVFKKVSKFVQNFRYDSSPTDHSSCRKTGMIDLCYVRISAEIRFFHFVTIYAFDGQTNRRTARLLQWQRLAMVCSAVIKDIVNFNPSFDGLWLWLPVVVTSSICAWAAAVTLSSLMSCDRLNSSSSAFVC